VRRGHGSWRGKKIAQYHLPTYIFINNASMSINTRCDVFVNYTPADFHSNAVASFLATEGSTRRIARDDRPSRPAHPACWIQTDKVFVVVMN
jgi:hypothetical protein